MYHGRYMSHVAQLHPRRYSCSTARRVSAFAVTYAILEGLLNKTGQRVYHDERASDTRGSNAHSASCAVVPLAEECEGSSRTSTQVLEDGSEAARAAKG